MAYKFSNQNQANFRIDTDDTSERLTLKGISANATADSIVAGVQGLLYIIGKDEDYIPETAIRTVIQNVDDE